MFLNLKHDQKFKFYANKLKSQIKFHSSFDSVFQEKGFYFFLHARSNEKFIGNELRPKGDWRCKPPNGSRAGPWWRFIVKFDNLCLFAGMKIAYSILFNCTNYIHCSSLSWLMRFLPSFPLFLFRLFFFYPNFFFCLKIEFKKLNSRLSFFGRITDIKNAWIKHCSHMMNLLSLLQIHIEVYDLRSHVNFTTIWRCCTFTSKWNSNSTNTNIQVLIINSHNIS